MGRRKRGRKLRSAARRLKRERQLAAALSRDLLARGFAAFAGALGHRMLECHLDGRALGPVDMQDAGRAALYALGCQPHEVEEVCARLKRGSPEEDTDGR